jgi:hypothetical protein
VARHRFILPLGSALLAVTLAASSLVACAAKDDDVGASPAVSEDAVTSLDPNGAQTVAITEPAALRQLEQNGYGFGHHFGIADDVRADALQKTIGWSSITHGIDANLAGLLAVDRELGVGMTFNHRLFDKAWLVSSRSRFALVAVTNRIDRANPGDCGEVRFIHRLEYDDPREGATSRMPMTVAVVVPQLPRRGESGCAGVATRWQSLAGKTGTQLATSAASGPLAYLPSATSFETNLQAIRWPSTVRSDMGGEAEYMLNVWKPASGIGGATAVALAAAPLENTPDVAAIKADPAKKRALLGWMKSNIWAIDRGVAKLPLELAAHTTYSYGPRGLARGANHPYAAAVTRADLDGALFGDAVLIKSASGLLRRLDEQSCPGCHQARAMAGFHVLGFDDDGGKNAKLNRLAVGTSPHFNEEIAWRSRLLRAATTGLDPSSPAEPRPFAERATHDGLVGQSCGLGADPSFVAWTCRADLACKDMVGDGVIGTCQPADGPKAGDACEKDQISASFDPHEDNIHNLDSGDAACRKWNPAGSCSGAAGGFPGGACAAACPQMGQLIGDEICGPAPPAQFNECMAGHEETFEQCMSPPKLSYRKACNVVAPCRDDYVCAFVPNAPVGTGACMPPYFIFQARVDGHE